MIGKKSRERGTVWSVGFSQSIDGMRFDTLVWLKLICQIFSQCSNAERSFWSKALSLSFLMILNRKSANSLAIEDFIVSGRSFMNHRNTWGPKTVPWSTPERTSAVSDLTPSRIACCFLWLRKDSIQRLTLPLTHFVRIRIRIRIFYGWYIIRHSFTRARL